MVEGLLLSVPADERNHVDRADGDEKKHNNLMLVFMLMKMKMKMMMTMMMMMLMMLTMCMLQQISCITHDES